MSVKLSTVELSRRLADSPLTRSDCAILRPLAVPTLADSLGDVRRNDERTQAEGQPGDSMRGDPASGGCPRAVGADAPLPCLRINNSNVGAGDDLPGVDSAASGRVPSWVRKKEFALKSNLLALCEHYPIGQIGMLTITYQDDQQCFIAAGKDFNSLATGVLNDRFLAWVKIGERTQKGVVHFHLLVVCKQEIRRGFDFSAVNNRDYRSVCPYLRQEWAFWSSRAAKGNKPARVGAAERYGFGGRVELKPIRTNAEAVANYLSKYLTKGFANRQARDKGVRLIAYSKSFPRRCGSRLSFYSPKAMLWRKKISLFAASWLAAFTRVAISGGHQPLRALTDNDLTALLGKRWQWRYRDDILAMPIPA